jgi:O-antigen biosynthesis protein
MSHRRAPVRAAFSTKVGAQHPLLARLYPPAKVLDRIRARWRLRREISLLSGSGLFDRNWYLAHYPDVAAAGMDPVRHYLLHGAYEGRDPGPDFDTRFYLARYQDVNRAGVNPLAHFLRFGKAEGREPSPTSAWAAEREGNLANPVSTKDPGTRNPQLSFSVAEALRRMANNPEPPVVLVPVHNAAEQTEACLESLLRHTGPHCRMVVIDDASTDPGIRTLLDRYQRVGRIEVVHNEQNLGFTRTINRGITLAGRSDVVFLNSDTRVTPGWLRNLRLAAYSGERVGTATAFSNNAGAFSAPDAGRDNPLPDSVSLDDYARAVSQASLRIYPPAPTGNGFCMYVRRDCLDATGLLDEEAFPRGYGEENDFCMRAGRLGWSHVIDDATLIGHARSASFGDAGADLASRARQVVDERYPEYSAAVGAFLRSERLRAARERVRDVHARIGPASPPKPRVVFVISTTTGGTPQTNEDLMAALSDRIEPFVLLCDSAKLSLLVFRDGTYTTLEEHALDKPLRAFPHRSDEYDAVVADWLTRYAIELVHIRHIARHGLGLIDVAEGLALPVVFSFHDFYAACPTVHLLDEANVYCGGKCTATEGECRYALWGDRSLPPLKHAAIRNWQQQIGAALQPCAAFVTTSAHTRKTFTEIYPFLADRKFDLIPHGRDFDAFEQAAPSIEAGGTIRILVAGNLSPAKGSNTVAELARQAKAHAIELHVMGALSSDLVPPTNFVYHGTYERGEFARKARAIKPHLGGIFSIWPETYCHTLTEFWASGIPVVGFDYGAVGERIRATGGGGLTPEPTVAGILAVVEQLRAHPIDHDRKVAAVSAWQKAEGRANSCARMGDRYLELYEFVASGLIPEDRRSLRS